MLPFSEMERLRTDSHDWTGWMNEWILCAHSAHPTGNDGWTVTIFLATT